MTIREYVDFCFVEPKHADIDARLANWARWAYNRGGSNVSPMFVLYRSTDANQAHGIAAESPVPVDAIDAKRIQKGVSALPEPHRLAVSWSYIKRNNPCGMARQLGYSLAGLARLVRDARQLLVNRDV